MRDAGENVGAAALAAQKAKEELDRAIHEINRSNHELGVAKIRADEEREQLSRERAELTADREALRAQRYVEVVFANTSGHCPFLPSTNTHTYIDAHTRTHTPHIHTQQHTIVC